MFKPSYRSGYVHVVLKARAWRRAPMRLLKWGKKMPSTNQYNLVINDDFDAKIPVHAEEAFHYGISFAAKYIGSMDVARPTSRVEIVAAMRRVRYEFKAKGVKKRKVTVEVSIDGVRVTTQNKKSKGTMTKFFGSKSNSSGNGAELMHHPIYRIFYVSHDSSDLKIFSYIARDRATNGFKCNVFKSNKKSQAMRIVRTVGQAFEVCHKLNQESSDPGATASCSSVVDEGPSGRPREVPAAKEPECDASESGAGSTKVQIEVVQQSEEKPRPTHLEIDPTPPMKTTAPRPEQPSPNNLIPTLNVPEFMAQLETPEDNLNHEVTTPLSAQHEVQLLKERLEQQAQQTRAVVAQLLLLRDQLAAEQAARCEAQARTHQLLIHNKELIEHIAALVSHLQERERGTTHLISAQQLTLLPQVPKNQELLNSCNGNGNETTQLSEALANLLNQSYKIAQNFQNNNIQLTPTGVPLTTPPTPIERQATALSFDEMGNKKTLTPEAESRTNANSYKLSHYQNSNAFPDIPPLSSHHSSIYLADLTERDVFSINKAGSKSSDDIDHLLRPVGPSVCYGDSQNSVKSSSSEETSDNSSADAFSSNEEAVFIMPLSHNGTLSSKGKDGRVKLIVPVTPSGSVANVVEHNKLDSPQPSTSGNTLKVPGAAHLSQAAPITRTTSEKVPNRSELMAALRSQWTRHTTK